MKNLRFLSNIKNVKRSLATVSTWNEWDALEEVIVGIPTNAAIPPLLIESKICIDPKHWGFYEKNCGKLWSDALGSKFWENVLKEHDMLVSTLKKNSIQVVHPDPQQFDEKFTLPGGKEISGFSCAMPRDILLIIGNRIIEAPMTWRSRYFEIHSYRNLIYKYYFQDNGVDKCDWIISPKPTYRHLFKEVQSCSTSPPYITDNNEITFDAADFVKAGMDLFVQRSQVTNDLGIEWVRRHVADLGIKIIELSFNDPRPMHIDGTIIPLKPGLILANPNRECRQKDALAKAGWKIIHCPERTNNKLPYYLGSPWLSLNLLSLSPDLIIVEEEDKELIEVLKKHDIESIPIPFRHCNSLGGSFHCWTVDVRRNGSLQPYSNW